VLNDLRITTRSGLDEKLGAGLFLLVKQSFRCPISNRAFAEYEEFVRENPDVPTGWIDVVEDRELSLAAAAATGITHESPQAILIRDGKPAWHASHGEITCDALETAIGG
jgi:bacillithiol system protein YtxJ